jgi:hypothetical protein
MLLQVVLVGNILCVEKVATHTTYMLDDGMGRAVTVRVWKVGDDWLPEQHEIGYVMQPCLFHCGH